MTIHLFGRTAEDVGSRQLWDLLAVTPGRDARSVVTARHAVDRRGPMVTFSIPPSKPAVEAMRSPRGADPMSADRSDPEDKRGLAWWQAF
jgi:hypothetical protein